MKKLMLAIAATTAFVSVASAEDWFTGTIGSEANGEWTMTPGEGGEITTNSTTLVLEDAAASFTATTPKAADSSQNLNFATSAKFTYSYDELPAIDDGAKAGVVVFENKYYVLAKDDTANKWVPTDIGATLDSPVAVSVTISNDTSSVYAIYNIGGTSIIKEVVASGNWSAVDYSGCGEVASLVGTTIPLVEPGYPIPGDKTIPKSAADAWAEAQGISSDKLAKILADPTTYAGGRTAAESCLLGVGTNENIVADVEDTQSDKLELSVRCTPTVAGRATFTLKKDGDAVVSGQSTTSFEYELADGIYTIVADVDGANKQLPVSQAIGVKGTGVAANKVAFIGAPWANCPATNLLKKTCCAAGDMMEVYDSNGDRWYTWSMTDGKWAYVADSGIIGDAEPELIIKKGQAVKYTAAAATAQNARLYTVGNVSTVNTTQVDLNKWNLIACPDGEIAAMALSLANDNDQAIVLGDDGVLATAVFQKFGKNGLYKKAGYNAGWEKVTDADKVECGFFLRPTKNDSVTWPAKAQ